MEYAGQGRGFRRGAGGLCCVGGGFGAFVAGVVARRVVRVRLWFGKLHCQPQTYGDGRHQAGAEQQNAARRQAKHNKGDTGPKQRSHDSKKRDVRRLSGKGKPPEVSGRSQGGAEQHVANDHGHCRFFEKHSRPQQDSNACGEGQQKRQHGCCEGAAGPRKERHPEGAPAALRHRKASCKAQKQPRVARQCQRYLTSGAHLQRGVQRARQQRAQRQPEIAAKADFHHQRFRGIECHGPSFLSRL